MANKGMSFVEVVDLADHLSLKEQETLLEVLRKRTVEQRRDRLAKEVKAAWDEHKRGRCKPASPADLLREALS